VRGWLDRNGNGAVDAGDTEIASGSFAENNDSLTLTLAAPLMLDAGTTDFIVTYDY